MNAPFWCIHQRKLWLLKTYTQETCWSLSSYWSSILLFIILLLQNSASQYFHFPNCKLSQDRQWLPCIQPSMCFMEQDFFKKSSSCCRPLGPPIFVPGGSTGPSGMAQWTKWWCSVGRETGRNHALPFCKMEVPTYQKNFISWWLRCWWLRYRFSFRPSDILSTCSEQFSTTGFIIQGFYSFKCMLFLFFRS